MQTFLTTTGSDATSQHPTRKVVHAEAFSYITLGFSFFF